MNNDSRQPLVLDRRGFLASLAAVAGLGLAGCSGNNAETAAKGSAAGSAAASADSAVPDVDAKAFEEIIEAVEKASDEEIAASTWATKVKNAGTLRVGSVQTSTFFSLLNPDDGELYGFDAGLAKGLAQYIFGDWKKIENTQVTSDTRESVLQNDQVDAVFATYTINDKRKELISFAGPYYGSQQAVLVLQDNSDIKSYKDLDGKTVAVQSGSNGPAALESLVPGATQQEFKTDEEARSALEQKRVDAYVIDYTMQIGALAKQPGKYKIAGDPFGDSEPYGIGVPKDSDAVQFINSYLEKIENDQTWAVLWQCTIGERVPEGVTVETPAPPAIGA